MQLFSNNAKSTLSASITNSATTIPIVAEVMGVMPTPTAPDYYLATLTNAGRTLVEVVKVTGRSANNLTVVRAQEGTTGLAWGSGDIIEMSVTKGTLERIPQNKATGTNSYAMFGALPTANDEALAIGPSAFTGQPSVWIANTPYTYGAIVKDTASDAVFFCYAAGTTHATTEPTWPATNGQLIADGTCWWLRIESEVAAGITLSMAIGSFAKCPSDKGVALGNHAVAAFKAVSIGDYSASLGSSVTIGEGATSFAENCLALGPWAVVEPGIGYGNVAVGPYSDVDGSKNRCAAFGADAINRVENSYVVTGLHLIRKDFNVVGTDAGLFFTGSVAVVFSIEVDLKILLDSAAYVTIPTGATFFIEEVGVVVTQASGVTVQPQVSFGVTGNTTAILAATATTKSAAKGRDVYTPVDKDGKNSLTASVKAVATATTLMGRFYWKGILVEDE